MQTILIATDFTAAAHNALVYGVQLAKDIHARVVLVNVVNPAPYSADMISIISNEELEKESRSLLEFEAHSVKKYNVPVEIKSAVGNTTEMIVSLAQSLQASWIVVGMKAKNKTLRKIFGSHAVTLSKYLPVPLIVIPEYAAYAPLSTIALANDPDDKPDLEVLDPLQELGLKFQSYMFIISVISDDNQKIVDRLNKPSRITWHLKELHSSYEFLNDSDVAHAINDFVVDHNIDMVAMIAREHNLIERIFSRSHIKELMFEVQVPLIILPGFTKGNGKHEFSKMYYHEQKMGRFEVSN